MEIRPQPAQEIFLSTSADVSVYGGAAGGGKSWSLLVEPLRWINRVPGFGAVIFRRTCPEITAEGGIWDQAGDIYPYAGGTPKLGDLSWSFKPYGNTISFSHMEHENTKYNWGSSQICCLEFDELNLFTESQFFFMFSRNRSVCGIRPYIRGACNPDPNWLKTTILAPWVDDEFQGIRAESGELRWFVRVDGKIKWVPQGTPDSRSITFVKASVYDNKILLDRNPEYIANLKALPTVERMRLLEGDWNVRREGLVYYQPDHGIDFQTCIVDEIPVGLEGQPVGGMDYGFHNPFAAIAGILDHDDVLWLTFCRYKSNTTLPVHSEALPKGIRWWCDPAQPESITMLRQAGHDCLACRHRPMRGASGETRSPKLSGIDMVSERIRTGRLKILRSACQPLIRELGMYQYDPAKLTEEPIDADNHACFVAGTLVTTMNGDVSIEMINPGDLVLTREGWFPVESSGMTGIDRDVWRLDFSDGSSLMATPDHLVWTENRGWSRIDSLRYGDIMNVVPHCIHFIESQSWEEQSKQSSSMVSGTIVTQSQKVCLAEFTSTSGEVKTSIGRSGNMPMDQFRRDITSTTKMATRSIMTSPIWSASLNSIISLCMENDLLRPREPILSVFVISQPNGMPQKKDEHGIESTGNESGLVGWLKRRLASIAARFIRLGTRGRQLDSVRSTVVHIPETNEEMTISRSFVQSAESYSPRINIPKQKHAPIFVVNVHDTFQRSDVYNLVVDGPPEFFANGVLVHNCDATRYCIVGITRGHAVPSVVSPEEIRDQQKARESVIEAQLRQRLEDVQQARHEDIDDPLWWDGDTTSDTLELIVEAEDAITLDQAVSKLGDAVVIQDDDGFYVNKDGGLIVRCFRGCGGYIAYAINKQGYGKVLRRRRV